VVESVLSRSSTVVTFHGNRLRTVDGVPRSMTQRHVMVSQGRPERAAREITGPS
jgi:hypothetical protein